MQWSKLTQSTQQLTFSSFLFKQYHFSSQNSFCNRHKAINYQSINSHKTTSCSSVLASKSYSTTPNSHRTMHSLSRSSTSSGSNSSSYSKFDSFSTSKFLIFSAGSAYLLSLILKLSDPEYYESLLNSASSQFLFAFGRNQYGNLGLGHEVDISEPALVTALANFNIKQVSAGGDSVLVLTEEGKVYSFGRGNKKVLGHNSLSQQNTPQLIAALADKTIVFVDNSDSIACAITKEGELYTWGSNSLGYRNPDIKDKNFGLLPKRVDSLKSQQLKSVSAGHNHVLVINNEGKVFGFGNGIALGINNRDEIIEPVEIVSLKGENIMQVACGHNFSLAVNDKGQLFSTGANDYGGTAQSTTDRYLLTFQRIPALANSIIKFIAAGQFHSAVINNNGELLTFGLGINGQIGNGTKFAHNPSPIVVRGILSNKHIESVDCGYNHTGCIDEKGNLYCFGNGRYGQLASKRIGATEGSIAAYREEPISVPGFNDNSQYRADQCALGNDFTLVRASLRSIFQNTEQTESKSINP